MMKWPMMARLFLLCAAVGVALVGAQSQEDIFHAVRDNAPVSIGKFLESGVDINETGPGGQTPLMHAVLTGNAKSAEFLISKGADATIPEKDGYTPMHGAGFQGRPEIAEMLIKHGLNPSDRHTDGFTPIHRACWGGQPRHTEMVRLLLLNGVPHDEKDGKGKTPLENVRGNMGTKHLLEAWEKGNAHKQPDHLKGHVKKD